MLTMASSVESKALVKRYFILNQLFVHFTISSCLHFGGNVVIASNFLPCHNKIGLEQ